MAKEKFDITKVKTRCCNASWIRKARATYVCTECGKDVTLEIVFLQDAMDYENFIPNAKARSKE